MNDKKYTILNYGCQMNESDSEHFAGQLSDLGYSMTSDYHDADVVVVNTCCVRESAELKILGKIGELKTVKSSVIIPSVLDLPLLRNRAFRFGR